MLKLTERLYDEFEVVPISFKEEVYGNDKVSNVFERSLGENLLKELKI